MTDAQTATSEHTQSRMCGGGRAKKKWSGVELATMVGGFIVFWPIGLVALGAKLFKGEMWPGASENVAPWTAWKAKKAEGGFGFANTYSPSWGQPKGSGNAAFDAYKKAKLEELEAAKRKLEDEQRAFAEYLSKLREAKDREEFDRFMSERQGPAPAAQ